MRFKKLHLKFLLFFLSIIMALGLTASYGWLKHQRYYTKTNYYTQINQIKFAKSLLLLAETKSSKGFVLSNEDFVKAFHPMKRYMPVDVYLGDELVWQLRYDRKVKDRPVQMNFEELLANDYKIVFGIYGMPPWFFGEKARFWAWLFSPSNWFSESYDYIWVPFVFFFSTVFFFVWSAIYRYRANYVDKILLQEIQELKKRK